MPPCALAARAPAMTRAQLLAQPRCSAAAIARQKLASLAAAAAPLESRRRAVSSAGSAPDAAPAPRIAPKMAPGARRASPLRAKAPAECGVCEDKAEGVAALPLAPPQTAAQAQAKAQPQPQQQPQPQPQAQPQPQTQAQAQAKPRQADGDPGASRRPPRSAGGGAEAGVAALGAEGAGEGEGESEGAAEGEEEAEADPEEVARESLAEARARSARAAREARAALEALARAMPPPLPPPVTLSHAHHQPVYQPPHQPAHRPPRPNCPPSHRGDRPRDLLSVMAMMEGPEGFKGVVPLGTCRFDIMKSFPSARSHSTAAPSPAPAKAAPHHSKARAATPLPDPPPPAPPRQASASSDALSTLSDEEASAPSVTTTTTTTTTTADGAGAGAGAAWPRYQLLRGALLRSEHPGDAQQAMFDLVNGMTRSLAGPAPPRPAPGPAAAAGDAPGPDARTLARRHYLQEGAGSPLAPRGQPFVFECASSARARGEAAVTTVPRWRLPVQAFAPALAPALAPTPAPAPAPPPTPAAPGSFLRLVAGDEAASAPGSRDSSSDGDEERVVKWRSAVKTPCSRRGRGRGRGRGRAALRSRRGAKGGGGGGRVGSGGGRGGGGAGRGRGRGGAARVERPTRHRRSAGAILDELEGRGDDDDYDSDDGLLSPRPRPGNVYAEALARLAAENSAAHAYRNKSRKGRRRRGRGAGRGRAASICSSPSQRPRARKQPRVETQGRLLRLPSLRPVISVSVSHPHAHAHRPSSSRTHASGSTSPPPSRRTARESRSSHAPSLASLPPPSPPPLLNPAGESAVAAYASALALGDGRDLASGAVPSAAVAAAAAAAAAAANGPVDAADDSSLAFWLRLICGPRQDDQAVSSLVRSQQVFAECARLLAANPPPRSPSTAPREDDEKEGEDEEAAAAAEAVRARERALMHSRVLFTRYLTGHRVRRARRHAARAALRRALLVMSVAFAPPRPAPLAPASAPAPAAPPGACACPACAPRRPASAHARAPAPDDKVCPPRWSALAAAKTIWARAEAPPSPAAAAAAAAPHAAQPPPSLDFAATPPGCSLGLPPPKHPVYVLPHAASAHNSRAVAPPGAPGGRSLAQPQTPAAVASRVAARVAPSVRQRLRSLTGDSGPYVSGAGSGSGGSLASRPSPSGTCSRTRSPARRWRAEGGAPAAEALRACGCAVESLRAGNAWKVPRAQAQAQPQGQAQAARRRPRGDASPPRDADPPPNAGPTARQVATPPADGHLRRGASPGRRGAAGGRERGPPAPAQAQAQGGRQAQAGARRDARRHAAAIESSASSAPKSHGPCRTRARERPRRLALRRSQCAVAVAAARAGTRAMSRSWPRVSSAGALGPRAARSSSPTHPPLRLAPAPAAAPEQVSAFLGSSSVPGAEWGGAHTPARRRRRSQSPPTPAPAPAPAPPAPPAPKKKSKEPPRRPKGTKQQQQQRGESAGAGGRAAAATPGTSCGSSAATESAPAPAPGDAKRKRAAPSAEKPQSRRSERPPTAGPANKPASSKARAKAGAAGAAPAPKKKKKPAPADEEPRPPAEDAPPAPAPTPEEPPEDAAEEALPCRSDSVRELFVATDLYSSGSDAELLSVLSDSHLPSGGKIEALSHSLVEMEEDDDTFHDVADELLGSLQSASAPIDIRMAPRLELDDLELAEIDSDVLCSSMTYGTSVAGNDTISVVIKHIRRQNIKLSGDDIDETSNITDDILTSMCNKDVGSQTDTPHSDESSKMFSASNVDVRVSSRSDEEYESVSCSMITPDTSLIVNKEKQEISPVSDTCEKGDPPFSSDMLFSDQCISAWESDFSERSAQDISATPCIHLTEDINVSEHNFLDNQSISLFMSSVSTNNKVEISSNSAVEVQRPLFVNDCENSKTDSSTWQIFPSSSVQNTVSNEDKLEMNHVNIYSENTDHIIFRDPSTSDLQNPQDVPRVPNPQSVEPSESEEPPELGNDLFLDASFSVQAKDEESLSTLASDDVCSSSSEEPVSCVSSDFFENALLLISPSTTDHEESTSAIDSSSLHDSKSSPSVSNSGPVPRSAQTTTCSFSFPEDTHPPYLSSHDFACTSGERRGVLGGLMASQRSSTSSPPRSCASEEDGTLRRSSSGGDAPGVRPHARPRAASSHVLCESLDGADDSSTIPICLTGRANVRFSSSKSTSNDSQTSVCVFLTSSQSKTSSEDAASALDTAHDVSSSEFFGQASAERLAAAPDRTYSSPQLHDEEVSPRGWAGGRACGSCSSSSVVHLVERAGPGGGRRSAAVLYPSRLLVSDMERQQRMDEWLAQQDVACLEAALRGGGGGGEWAMEAACRYAKFRLRAAGEGVPYFRGCAPGDAPAGRPLAVASAPPHRPSPSRASLAPAEARCGGGGGAEEVMIVVCCSDSSCADANAGELAPLSCVRCAGKGWGLPKEVSRLRSPWYTPDLVSDLPEGCPAALNAAGLHQPRRCGDCRRETWRRAQVLLRRPESAPGPGSGQCCQCVGEDIDAGAGGGGGERIVCAPVKDRIQIFNSVAAAPRSRPVSAQRSVELELGPSTTRVKERILAFNAGLLPAPDASAAPAPAPAAAAHCQSPPPGPLRGQAHPVASRAAAAAEGTAPEPGPPPPPPDAPRVSPANSATSLSSSESSREGCALALVADDASESSVDKAALVAHDAGRRCAVSMALAAVAAASLWYAYN